MMLQGLRFGGIQVYNMTEEQKQKAFNSFKKTIDKRDSRFINKELYYHLNINCNFVAHFNLEGFREAYSGEHFREFVEQFDPESPASQWVEAPEISIQFDSLNQEMVQYVESKTPEIYESIH